MASDELLVARTDEGKFNASTGSGQTPSAESTEFTKTGQSGKRKGDEMVGEQTIGNVSTGLARG